MWAVTRRSLTKAASTTITCRSRGIKTSVAQSQKSLRASLILGRARSYQVYLDRVRQSTLMEVARKTVEKSRV